MTVSPDQPRANALPCHYDPEDFRSFAHGELQASPPCPIGVCFNPGCSVSFVPRRVWQVYCSARCASVGVTEMRKWGHKLALSSLIYRMGKYERHDAAIIDRTRAARRHISQVNSAWLADRKHRLLDARGVAV